MIEKNIYKLTIDPLLSGMRRKASLMFMDNLNIIDIGCGTGAFALKLSEKANYVIGIDSSEEMIKVANQTKNKRSIKNAEFVLADASNLKHYESNKFDVASISLAIHQFDRETGLTILKEMKRIAKEVLIIDYACPLPKNIYKSATYFIERLAGKEHYMHFRTYQQYGGIDTYLNQLNLKISKENKANNSIFSMVLCK